MGHRTASARENTYCIRPPIDIVRNSLHHAPMAVQAAGVALGLSSISARTMHRLGGYCLDKGRINIGLRAPGCSNHRARVSLPSTQ